MESRNNVISFIGLGSMGKGMAKVLIENKFLVKGYDVYAEAMRQFVSFGGQAATTPQTTALGAKFLVLMVTNAAQVEEVLFGNDGAIAGLPDNSAIILCSTVPPEFARRLQARLESLKRGLELVDAPVSGGVVRAANGTLTIMVSGSIEALETCHPVLNALSSKLYVIGNAPGEASSVKMINQLLAGVHIASASEAIAMAESLDLDTHRLFEVIRNSEGNSWMFENRVPHMLENDFSPKSSLSIFVKDLGIVLDEARRVHHPTPLAAIAHQQFLLGNFLGFGKEDDSALIKVWRKLGCVQSTSKSQLDSEGTISVLKQAVKSAAQAKKVAILGFGPLASKLASDLVDKGFQICSYHSHMPSKNGAPFAGMHKPDGASSTVKGADVIVISLEASAEIDEDLFGNDDIRPHILPDSVVILYSSVSPDFIKNVSLKFKGIDVIDASFTSGALNTPTVFASGSVNSFLRAGSVIETMAQTVYLIPGGVGAASSVRGIIQLLAGIQVTAAAEAIALAAKLDLNTRQVYDIITHAAGNSQMFERRVCSMLDHDFRLTLTVKCLLNDLSDVLRKAASIPLPLPLTSTALQQLIIGAASGLENEADSSIVKVYEQTGSVSVFSPAPNSEAPISKQAMLQGLPSHWLEDPTAEIRNHWLSRDKPRLPMMVVLDDDPTGTQTVNGVTVLTEWSVESIQTEMRKLPKCFFILTNSRSLPSHQARQLVGEICSNVKTAAREEHVDNFTIILRGDSTLRGHFPQEVEAAQSVLGPFDVVLLCPFFLEGGRITVNDVHYVQEGEMLLPVGSTEFAQDATFGYKSSNLKKWVEEKTAGAIPEGSVQSISLQMIREGGPSAVFQKLSILPKGSVCVVNCASETDIKVVASAVLKAERSGTKFLCRTGASFVSACLGMERIPFLTPEAVGISKFSSSSRHGALIVVGSYVPRTSKQVDMLVQKRGRALHSVTLDCQAVAFGSSEVQSAAIASAADSARAHLIDGQDVMIVTSRKLITGNGPLDSLAIGARVSASLVEVVKLINVEPRYILAKGGITSSDIASKSLQAKQALVIGQALPGVPVWKLGAGCTFPGLPYIVFPGNVGDVSSLSSIVSDWSRLPRVTTTSILREAELGGYAVGAFNVYNLEGVRAVASAAAKEQSPAIIQIHPSSLKAGGAALVAAARAAADEAKVPISLHFDHGSDEDSVLAAMDMGFDSVMIDASHFPFEENLKVTQRVCAAGCLKSMAVEAELGRLSGSEDGISVEERMSHLTDIKQASEFIEQTNVKLLAVSVGNVHGHSSKQLEIDFPRLQELQSVASKRGTILVLHGASGLPSAVIQKCIGIGVRKFNVNTEIRMAYLLAMKSGGKELLNVMENCQLAMESAIIDKMRMFGSSGRV